MRSVPASYTSIPKLLSLHTKSLKERLALCSEIADLSQHITLTSLLHIANLISLFPFCPDTFQNPRIRPSILNFRLFLTAQKSYIFLHVHGHVSRYIFYPESCLHEREPTIFQLAPLMNPCVLGKCTVFSELQMGSVNLFFGFVGVF